MKSFLNQFLIYFIRTQKKLANNENLTILE